MKKEFEESWVCDDIGEFVADELMLVMLKKIFQVSNHFFENDCSIRIQLQVLVDYIS